MKQQLDRTSSDPAAERFLGLLRELFRFGTEDLEFGIYRILNARRAQIEHFIAEELPQVMSKALEGTCHPVAAEGR